MSRKKEALTLSVPPGTKEQLEAVALRLGILWGKSPSVSGLLVAIADRQFEVGEPFTLESNQVEAFKQAIKLLTDSGHLGDAQILAGLLLDRGNLEIRDRQSIWQQVSQPDEGWRIQVDRLRHDRQPFSLLYRDAQGKELEYTVRYAEISFEEKRFYLQIWCDETQDIKDPSFPELIHNRCLRLDRIQAIVPTSGEWRENLDFMKVYLHFYRGLVKAYEAKDKDISNEVIGDVRQVVRRVSNPFWVIREVLRYGKDCEVVAPDALRARVKEELRSLCQLYDVGTDG